jgi:hypothetical protein
MKRQILLFEALLLLAISCHAAYLDREYNTWYRQDAILYDITQTADGQPVMISISQPGFDSANMVISYIVEGKCPESAPSLDINSKVIPATFVCVPVGNMRIEHYAVKDAAHVNDLVKLLLSDFTLLVQGNIKVWAANVKTPKYGMAPRF